ncbi:cytochrome P450 6B5-like [Pectinophora gossypiella]|uniref:cytochrome P450 6B5-like n=1 Tax=Pectinophora gossypiella TaxID=13191 RepID=UPI00214E2B16|nr:cytochrome P450 6B5-like [Pectinophora gossypiella]
MLMYAPLAFIAVGYLVYWYITRTFNYWKNRNVAYPAPVPLFGNIKDSVLRKKFIGVVFKELYDQFPKEKAIGIYRMTTPCVLVRDLDIMKQILIKDFNLFVDRGVEFSKEGLGANLFHADGDIWKVLRTKFTPIFTSGKLKNMFPLVSERADMFIENMKKICRDKPEQDLQSLSKKYTMSTISACAFGLDIKNDDDTNFAVLEKLDKLIFKPTYGSELDMMFPGILKKISSSLFPAEVHAFFNDLVKSIFEQRKGVPSNRKDFMDLIIEMRQQKIVRANKNVDDSEVSLELTDSLIAAQAFVFYAAGFETSSATISFLLYELSQNRDVQDKLIAEIDETLEKCGGNISFDVLMEMPYLTRVFEETLRKYPIVDPLQRCAQTDYKIPGTDITVKKGQIVLFPVLGIHHDEKYYPNPEVFDPDRFTPENSRDRHPCAYQPFGVGPRNCIGMRFAKVQSRTFIVKLLSNFRIEASERTPFKNFDGNRLVMAADGGMYLNFVARQKR